MERWMLVPGIWSKHSGGEDGKITELPFVYRCDSFITGSSRMLEIVANKEVVLLEMDRSKKQREQDCRSVKKKIALLNIAEEDSDAATVVSLYRKLKYMDAWPGITGRFLLTLEKVKGFTSWFAWLLVTSKWSVLQSIPSCFTVACAKPH